jgi:hypothetical protein
MYFGPGPLIASAALRVTPPLRFIVISLFSVVPFALFRFLILMASVPLLLATSFVYIIIYFRTEPSF